MSDEAAQQEKDRETVRIFETELHGEQITPEVTRKYFDAYWRLNPKLSAAVDAKCKETVEYVQKLADFAEGKP